MLSNSPDLHFHSLSHHINFKLGKALLASLSSANMPQTVLADGGLAKEAAEVLASAASEMEKLYGVQHWAYLVAERERRSAVALLCDANKRRKIAA